MNFNRIKFYNYLKINHLIKNFKTYYILTLLHHAGDVFCFQIFFYNYSLMWY